MHLSVRMSVGVYYVTKLHSHTQVHLLVFLFFFLNCTSDTYASFIL